MHTSFKAYKLRVRVVGDASRSFNEMPIKVEFRFGFNGSALNMVLFNLLEKSYTSYEALSINTITENHLEVSNEKNKIQIFFEANQFKSLEEKTILNLSILTENNPIELEYIGYKLLFKGIEGETKNIFVVKAIKVIDETKISIQEGYFSPLEIDFAFSRINQKLNELKYFDFNSFDNGQLMISVPFYKDSKLDIEAIIESEGFDYETILKITKQIERQIRRL
jgi:hypothetical protein